MNWRPEATDDEKDAAAEEALLGPEEHRDDCRSCRGFGYFREDGTATEDKRERKCLDCSGTGKRLTKIIPIRPKPTRKPVAR